MYFQQKSSSRSFASPFNSTKLNIASNSNRIELIIILPTEMINKNASYLAATLNDAQCCLFPIANSFSFEVSTKVHQPPIPNINYKLPPKTHRAPTETTSSSPSTTTNLRLEQTKTGKLRRTLYSRLHYCLTTTPRCECTLRTDRFSSLTAHLLLAKELRSRMEKKKGEQELFACAGKKDGESRKWALVVFDGPR